MFNLIPRGRETRPKLFYSPFKEMEDMVNRMIGDFVGEPGKELSLSTETPSFPGLNIYKDDNDYVIEASVPGYNKDNITVEVDDNFLTIKGEKKEEKEEKEKDYYYREFHSGSFQRSVRLPRAVNPDDLKAKYRDGLLELRMPVTEPEKKAHSIKIE